METNKETNKDIKEHKNFDNLVDDPNMLAVHYLKVRNGEPGMAFFTAKFDVMEVHERHTEPEKIQRKLKNT